MQGNGVLSDDHENSMISKCPLLSTERELKMHCVPEVVPYHANRRLMQSLMTQKITSS